MDYENILQRAVQIKLLVICSLVNPLLNLLALAPLTGARAFFLRFYGVPHAINTALRAAA